MASAQKILAIEYAGKDYPATRAELRRLAEDPLVDAPNIIVTFETEEGERVRQRPYRFASGEVTFAPDGTAKLF